MSETPPRSGKPFPVPRAEPVELQAERIDEFLIYAGQAPGTDRERLREVIHSASKDRAVLDGLFERVERQRESDFGAALVILAVIGELQNVEALDRLDRLVWEELPKEDDEVGHGALGKRDVLEMLQSKAVEGIAGLGTAEAEERVFRVIRDHPSPAVRSTAVDAFLFNRGDSVEAHDRLRDALSPGDAALADRARHTGSVDRDAFNADLKRFYVLHPEEVAPEPGRPLERPDRGRPEPPTRYER